MASYFSTTGRIYLDHAATTPVRREVDDAMRPFLAADFGNPSSLHEEGRKAREALDGARRTIRRALAADDFDVVFTGSGTEADNAAILGVVLAGSAPGGEKGKVVTSSVEHPAVLNLGPLLRRLGVELVTVDVDGEGRVDPDRLARCVDGATSLVSLMAANNEVGTLQPVGEAGHLMRERGVPVHTDAVQLVGKEAIELDPLPVDLVTISGHKICGPKGVGAVLVRRGLSFSPLLRGGAQQGGLRAGTEGVAAAVGLARAVELAEAERVGERRRLAELRDRLRGAILERFEKASWNSPESGTLPHILNVSFPTVEGESLMTLLDAHGVAVSTGSACNVGARKPSYVLRAMGRSDAEIRGSLRFSLGRLNDSDDIAPLLEKLERAVDQLQRVAP